MDRRTSRRGPSSPRNTRRTFLGLKGVICVTRPQSSEDLKTADEEEGWVRAGDPEHDDTDGAVKMRPREDAGLHALLGVNSIVVGHFRAAAELRRTMLSPQSPRDPLAARATRGGGSMGGRAGGEVRHVRSSSLRDRAVTVNGGHPRDTVAREAASAAAVRGVEGRDGQARSVEAAGEESLFWTQPKVSISAVLDIAVNLFGSGGGGRRSGGGSGFKGGFITGKDGLGKRREEGLVTFTVDVHTGGSTTLGIGVKELGGGAVVVQDLHKPPGEPPGPAERAGVALDDVILGINYEPLEKGLVHTAALLEEAITLAGFVKLQISRHITTSARRRTLPNKDCPIVTELMWRTAQLRRAGILTSAERHTIAGFILQRMAWEEGTSLAPAEPPRAAAPLSVMTTAPVTSLVKCAASAQLDSLVLRVKGLREAIHVCCLHAKSTLEPAKLSSVWGPQVTEDVGASEMATPATTRVAVRYVLRAEDVGTGREWLVFPRYSDFSELQQELLAMWPPIIDLPFPAKRPVAQLLRGAAGIGGSVVEERIVGLEAFLHGALTLLGIYASVDSRCAGCLHMIQDFLGMPNDLFCAEAALPPALCGQKREELLLYRFLNQVDSPAAKMKHLLMRDFERDVSLAPDVESFMRSTSSRLRHLQEFVLERHEQQLSSYIESSDLYTTNEAKASATRKAVRRQVELSLYLPLRRCLWKELASRLKVPARQLQRAIKALRRSPPSVLGVETPGVLASEEWGPAKEAMRQATRRVLPTDQIDGLCRAAEHIAALHASLQQNTHNGIPRGDNYDVSNGNATSDRADDIKAVVDIVDNGEETAHWRTCDDEEYDGVFVDGSTTASDSFSFGDDSGEALATIKNATDSSDVERELLEHDHVDIGRRNSTGRATANAAEIGRHRTGSLGLEVGREGQEGQVEDIHGQGDMLYSSVCIPNGNVVGGLDEPPQNRRVRKDAGDIYSESPASNGTMSVTGTIALARVNHRRSWTSPSSEAPDVNRPRTHCRTSSDDGAGSWGSGSGGDGKEEAVAARGCSNTAVDTEQRLPIGSRVGMAAASTQVVEEEAVSKKSEEAMGADDFLPLFALALVHSAPADLLLPQTLLTHLMDVEGSLSEAGYLVATLEAAVSFITQVYASSCCTDGEQEAP